MDEELKNHIAASVAQIDQDRHNIHKLAEDLKNAIPHIGLEAFEKSIRKLQLAPNSLVCNREINWLLEL